MVSCLDFQLHRSLLLVMGDVQSGYLVIENADRGGSFAAYENLVGIAEAVGLKEQFGVAPMAEFGALGPDEGEGVKEKDRGREAH